MHPLAPEQQDKSLKPVPAGQTPISRQELAERIIADALPVRFQVQLHKVIWPPGTTRRGVMSQPVDVTSHRQTARILLRAYESRNVTFIEPDGSWPIVWERARACTSGMRMEESIWI